MPPAVSVLLPVYNESAFIDDCMQSLATQDYEGELTIFVAEGGSIDGTVERLHWWAQHGKHRLVIVDNPERNQAAGLNLVAQAAPGPVLLRADGHTTYEPDYVRKSVETLYDMDATAVGGRQVASGDSPVARATVSAMSLPVAVGTARFRHAEHVTEADTVYLGAFRKEDFERYGGYRHLPGGVAEDADLYYRWRRQGATVILNPAIRSAYRPRDSWSGLARQYFRYGVGKAEMLYLNRRLPSPRPLAPLLLVAGLTAGLVLAATGRPALLAVTTGAWAVALGYAGAVTPGSPGHRLRTVVAVAVIHLTYGTGLIAGLVRGPARVRHLRPN